MLSRNTISNWLFLAWILTLFWFPLGAIISLELFGRAWYNLVLMLVVSFGPWFVVNIIQWFFDR